MERWIYIDGKFLPEEEAKISVFDHGFLYGDGVFEGIRAYNGRVFRLEEHLTRVRDSARAINLTIPLSRDELREKILETLRRNKLKDAYIRLVVSRGKGDLGLDPRKCPRSSTIIIAHKISVYPEDFYEKGLEVAIVSTRRISPSALDARIKSLNYLNNILAKMEANLQGMGEGIMLSQDGYVAEGTADNIFVVKDGELLTPPTWIGILKGITRDAVIELAKKEGMPVKEETFTPFILHSCQECFLTGTGAEIIPVTKVDGKVIGEGKAGPITRKLIKKFRQRIMEEGTPIYSREG